MKFWSFMLALFCAGAALAKSDSGKFNQAIMESVKSEMRKDGEVYRKDGRAPASVETNQEKLQDEQKNIDKMERQFKQVGHPSW